MSSHKIKYKKILQANKTPIKCDFCDMQVLPAVYLRHLKAVHNLNLSSTCIWCMNYSWNRKDKTVDNYHHRFPCLIHRIKKPTYKGDDDDDDHTTNEYYIIRGIDIVGEPSTPPAENEAKGERLSDKTRDEGLTDEGMTANINNTQHQLLDEIKKIHTDLQTIIKLLVAAAQTRV